MSDAEMLTTTAAASTESAYVPVAIDQKLFRTPESRRIVGGAGTGKTESLVTQATTLLNEGTAPNDLLVLCATPTAAASFSSRLADVLNVSAKVEARTDAEAKARAEAEANAKANAEAGTRAEAGANAEAETLTATTPCAVALNLLSQDEARSWSGRPARLLATFEVNFLLEDMKTSGIRPKRLREMLKFFYRGWAELAEDDPAWLITAEERQLHALLRENLVFMQGMLEPELSKLAVGFLRNNAKARAEWQKKHVLVDDFPCLSRASQLLAHLLASQTLTVTGDRCGAIEVFDSYPYPAGLDEFLIINPNTHCEDLTTSARSVAVTTAQNSLLDDESISAEDRVASTTTPSDLAETGSVDIGSFGTPEEEVEDVAVLIADLLNSRGYQPQDIGIVTLHRLWTKAIGAQLEKRGVPLDSLFSDAQFTGDIRDLERSMALRVYTALRLVVSPTDAAAWRCWCGFGDYLTRSATFVDIKALAQNTQRDDGGLIHALEFLDKQTEPSLPGSEGVLAAYRAGCALIEKSRGLTGDALLRNLTRAVTEDADADVPPVLRRLLADSKKMDAQAMVARAEQRLFFPQFSPDKERVRLLEPKDLCSLPFKVLFICGFVDGFLPCRDYFDETKMSLDQRIKTHASDTQLLYLMLSAAQKSIVFSYFKKTDIENAERLKLKIARIRFENGSRVCVIASSELLKLL
ncbi:MAG: AAA family ATPase [Coriobacteriales bacterium]|jgi:superfamily I DNA/RNA helicase|nr:AAA family ATPase [Coriobacteriales bacterium]